MVAGKDYDIDPNYFWNGIEGLGLRGVASNFSQSSRIQLLTLNIYGINCKNINSINFQNP